MPSQVNEEMVFVARDCQSILDICDKLAEVSARLLERDQTRLLDSPQLVSRISIKDRDSSLMAAGRLSDAPVIARIVCKDETNRTRIFYTTPVLAPPGVARANLSSIYSSFGRLTFLPLGGSIKTAKGETLTVIERALLRPRDYVKERDAFNTLFESHSRDPIRVKSLRATIAAFGERRKTPREPQDASSAVSLEAPLRPEALDVVVDEGEIRPLIEGLRLKAPLIVSSAQDEIGRFPLSARPVIIGPPGTGKTVSLIRRLDFRISREALEEDEPGYIDHLDKLGGPPHAASWRLFTPTRELKAYVKDAAESLAVPDFERNCACWEDERLALASYLGLLDSLIAVPDGEGLLSAAAKSDTAGWYKDFTAFHLDCFYRSLSAKAKRLAQDEDPAFSSLGAALLDIVAKSASKPLSWFRECLGLRQDELAELLKERNSLFNQELKSLFNDLAARDPSLPGALVTLQTSASSQAPIEGARLRIAALRLYREAAADKALAVFRGRPLPAESLSAKAAAFLGDGRLPSQSRLNELGADRQRAIALRRFKVDDKLFLDGYFEAIVPSYLRFKRSSRLWYDGPGYAPAKVEGLELDLLILSVLEPGSELAKAESREPGPSPRSRAVARHRYLMRNQVLIDDASYFSPVQLKAMAALAHPATGSVSLAADLTSAARPWSLTSLDQLEWAVPRHSLVELSVNYRQSRRLAELSDALAGGPRQRLTGSFYEDHGAPRPVLASGIEGASAQAAWLFARMEEIRERAGRLPAIGVIVPPRAVCSIARRLAKVLESSGLGVSILGSDPPAGKASRVWVLSFEQARGLEFEGVLIVDPPGGPLLRLAATRAASYLGVCLTAKDVPAELSPLKSLSQDDWAQPEVPLETLDI